RRQILYIPNGIDMANVRDLPGVEEKGYVLFASGRIIPAKGAHLMLEALDSIGYDGKVFVIGNRDHSPEYAHNLEKMAASLNVLFLDIIKEKKELMARVKNAGMFVFPSYHEGMSNMLLEAASLQVPLICSDIPGNRQVFTDDETFFFRSGDSSDLAEKIRYVLDHPREANEVARKGYERLEKEYNWEHLSRRYAGIYDWLIQNKKPLNRGNSFDAV
ncbi:MAG: glycosyltransferase family 4 protein, partial [Bacteroidota bacterium]